MQPLQPTFEITVLTNNIAFDFCVVVIFDTFARNRHELVATIETLEVKI